MWIRLFLIFIVLFNVLSSPEDNMSEGCSMLHAEKAVEIPHCPLHTNSENDNTNAQDDSHHCNDHGSSVPCCCTFLVTHIMQICSPSVSIVFDNIFFKYQYFIQNDNQILGIYYAVWNPPKVNC